MGIIVLSALFISVTVTIGLFAMVQRKRSEHEAMNRFVKQFRGSERSSLRRSQRGSQRNLRNSLRNSKQGSERFWQRGSFPKQGSQRGFWQRDSLRGAAAFEEVRLDHHFDDEV